MQDHKKLREEKYTRLTNAPIYPLLWRMAIPSMVGMIVSSVYSMTDTFFVGKLDCTSFTAAVGLVFSFISFIQAIGFWLGYGSGNYISRQVGKKKFKEAEAMASIGCTVAIISGLLLMLLGFIFIRPLALILGAGDYEELTSAVIRYLRITLVSVPFMLVSNVLYNQLRLQGAAKDSMTGLLVGMLLNMILDPVFILGLKLGVAGAALASLIGQLCGALILMIRAQRNGNVPVRPFAVRPDRSHIREILAGGAPNFCRQGITSICGAVLNHAAAGFGEPVIAGMTIALRVLSMGYALVIGFGQGFQPICLVNYGAGKMERVKKAFVYALGTVTIFLLIAAAFFIFGNDRLSSAFSGDAAVIQISSDFIRAFGMVLPFMGYYILAGMLMQNIGRFGQATLITTMENGLLLIPMSLVIPRLFGLNGLVWCKPIASICSLVLSMLIGVRAWKKYL